MRRMLDPKEVGGLPSTIEFDKDGNRKVSKDLGVDGKLKLKSLVSASNPDGDITKELGGGGGGNKYIHSVEIIYGSTRLYFNLYNSIATTLTLDTLKTALLNKKITCNGYAYNSGKFKNVLTIYNRQGQIYVDQYYIEGTNYHYDAFIVDSTYKITDIVSAA